MPRLGMNFVIPLRSVARVLIELYKYIYRPDMNEALGKLCYLAFYFTLCSCRRNVDAESRNLDNLDFQWKSASGRLMMWLII